MQKSQIERELVAMPVKPEYKVTLLGAGGVGKSALTLRIISGVFTPTYNPTIEDYYRHDTNIDGVGPCIVEILDTAGTEQFASMRQLYITNGQAFALVYAVDDRTSFEEVKEIYHQIAEVKSPQNISVVLVGNKCDLEDRREVEIWEGDDAAKEMGDCPFIETSAKDGTNVFDFFATLVMCLDGRLRNGVVKRGASAKTKSLKVGKRKERSRSQPDLRTYSLSANDSCNYYDHPLAAAEAIPGHSTKGRKCSIM